jgi:hypothetical protein
MRKADVILLVSILCFVMLFYFYHQFVSEPNFETKALFSKASLWSYKETLVVIIVILHIFLVISIWIYRKQKKETKKKIDYIDENGLGPYDEVPFKYLDQRSPKEFEEETYTYTSKSLKRLFSTPEYKSMREKKGENEENWNWQRKERLFP